LTQKHVHGSFQYQYKRIYNYAHELLRSNLGSTMKVKSKESDGPPIFKRFYVYFKVYRNRFCDVSPSLVWMVDS